MNGYRATFTILPVLCAVALLLTAALAYYLGGRLQTWRAILTAALALPLAIASTGIYLVATTQPGDAPPGMILIGVLIVAGAVTPLTLFVSALAVHWARR
jgi:hypothetical protein